MKKTLTVTLNDRETALLEELAKDYGHITTPTSLLHAAAEIGLLRIAAARGISLKGWKPDELGKAFDKMSPR